MGPLHWAPGVLATGPPGKSLLLLYLIIKKRHSGLVLVLQWILKISTPSWTPGPKLGEEGLTWHQSSRQEFQSESPGSGGIRVIRCRTSGKKKAGGLFAVEVLTWAFWPDSTKASRRKQQQGGGRDTQGGSNLTQCDLCRILPEKPILHFNKLDDENCIS